MYIDVSFIECSLNPLLELCPLSTFATKALSQMIWNYPHSTARRH